MANTFKNAKLVCSTAIADFYTCPANTTAVVFLLQAANVGTRSETLTLTWTDASNGNAVTRLANAIPVPAYESQGMLTGKLVLEAGDKLRAQCSTPSMIELTASILEQS